MKIFTDNRRKPFFQKNGQQFFLKIVNKEKTMREQIELIEMLNKLATESEIDLDKNLRMRGEHLKTLHKTSELWQVSEEWLSTSFENESNRNVFIIEDEEGRPISATIASINCPRYREAMKVSEDVGTFVYITHVITRGDFKSCGCFSLTLNKIMTMLSNPKRELPAPIYYSISVSAAKAERESDGEEITYIMNLPRYAKMWQNRFENNQLQPRFQSLESAKVQEGRERVHLENFLDKEKKNDEKKVSDFVESHNEEATREGKWVRGLFLEGRQNKSYAEAVQFKRATNPKISATL